MSGHKSGKGVVNNRKWLIQFSDSSKKSSGTSAASPVGYLENPPLFDDATEDSDQTIVTKQGWSIALGPWKQLPMNLILMFMAGNTISLFPIMMLGMMAFRPIQALIGYRDVFSKLTGEQVALQRFSYIVANLLGIAMAMYKCHTMGLLPTSPSDWVEFLDQRQNLEYSFGGFSLS